MCLLEFQLQPVDGPRPPRSAGPGRPIPRHPASGATRGSCDFCCSRHLPPEAINSAVTALTTIGGLRERDPRQPIPRTMHSMDNASRKEREGVANLRAHRVPVTLDLCGESSPLPHLSL